MKQILGDIGRGFYKLFIATLIVAMVGGGIALATNYTMTQGVGTTFGSLVVSAVNYAQQLICDPTTPANCGSVKAGNTAATTDVAQVVIDANVLAAVQAQIPACTSTPCNNIGLVGGSVNVTQTDCSIALTTGGTAQNIITAGATLHGFRIMNIDASAGSGEPVWVSFTTTAAAATIASYPLAAPTATTFAGAGSYSSEFASGTNGNVSVVAATTGHKISCTKW